MSDFSFPTSSFYQHLFKQVSLGLLVYQPLEPVSSVGYRLLESNSAARQWLTGQSEDETGNELHAIPDFWRPFMDRVRQTGQLEQFEWVTPSTEESLIRRIPVSVHRVDDYLVVTLAEPVVFPSAAVEKHYPTSLLQQLIDISPSGITVYEAIRDTTGTITDFRTVLYNKAAMDIMNQSVADIERPMRTRFSDQSHPGLFDFYVRLTEQKKTNRTVRFYPDLGKWLDIASIQMGNGFMVVFNDATALQEFTHQLEEQAQQRQNILDAAINGIMLLEAIRDEQGRIVDFLILAANRAASEDFFHRPVSAMVNQRLLQCFPGNIEAGFFAAYSHVTETGQPQRLESYYRDEQLDAWYDVSIVQQGDGVVITFVDITQARADREKVNALVRELQRSNESLEQFAYIASHDLQEPLRKLQAFGDIMQNQFADSLSEGEVDMVRRIQGSARRMQDLIRDLLTYSRIATQTEPSEPINLTQIANEVMGDLEIAIKEKNALVDIQPLPTVLGSAFRMRQLFQNLLSNALKFQSPDAIPHIGIKTHPAGPGELPAELADLGQKAFIVIEVTDNGIGFEEKYKDRIFHPFQRLHNRLTYSGTGIGLAICRKVAEGHGGAIDVSSELGVGTTFKVFLPASY